MTKKLISMLLSVAMVLSVAVVGISGVSAAIDRNGRYVPSEGVETHRIYFAMPESWKNEKFGGDTAGAYWWSGSDACGSIDGVTQGPDWPGYKMQVADADNNIYYIDLPTDVPNVIFNNYINGGRRETDDSGNVTFEFGEEQFTAAKQTVDVICQYYSEGDDDYYDGLLDGDFWTQAQKAFDGNDKTFFGNFADNFFEDPHWGISMTFDNMIYVINPNYVISSGISGKEIYGGEFYFYYGLNKDTGYYEYGALPNYEMAKKNGLVYKLDKPVAPGVPVQPTEPSQDSQPSTEKNTISFDVRKSGWNNVKTVYCHMWRADGTGSWPAWQSRAEKCAYDSMTGIATYDLSKTGHNIKKSDGKLYCVIFSANTGMQTYNAIMSGKCIGDTLYCTGNLLENPEDSEKKANEAVWAKTKDCGPEKKITSTGNIVGTALPEGETDASMLACFLIAYYDQPEKMDKVPALVKELNLSTSEVLRVVNKKLDNSGLGNAESIKLSIKAILDKIEVSTPSISKLENTAGGIKLSWNKVSGTYGYRLYRKTSSGWKRFKDTTTTSYTDSSVTVNKTETYTIRCIDSSGNTISGFNSKGWSKKYTPVAPTISKLENTSGGIKLTWNKIAGVYGYRVYYKPTSGGWKRLKDTTSTTFTDSAVSANQTKTYTIRCIDKSGNTVSGYNSKGWSKKYSPVAPTISKLENTSGGIKLTWNKITGVYGYRVYYKPTSGGWKRLKDTTSTTFTDSAVSTNQTKTYTIRCIDKNGNTVSGYNSTGWSKKYSPVAPTITKLTNTSKGVSVTWNKIPGVYGYRLYRKYDGGSWTRVKDITATNYTDSDAKKGKKVTYTVRCIDKNGNTISGYNSTGWSITRK